MNRFRNRPRQRTFSDSSDEDEDWLHRVQSLSQGSRKLRLVVDTSSDEDDDDDEHGTTAATVTPPQQQSSLNPRSQHGIQSTNKKKKKKNALYSLDSDSSDGSWDEVDKTEVLVSGLCIVDTNVPPNKFQTPEKKKAAKTTKILNEYKDSAWDCDASTKEMFLNPSMYQIPDVEWPNLRVPSQLYSNLYTHQKEGVQWMASLHCNGVGGILGDDMGLGKTYQTLAFLGGLLRTRTIRNVLVVVPVSILRSWEKEADVVLRRTSCVRRISVTVVSSNIKREKRRRILENALTCATDDPHIILVTYGLVSNNPLDFVLEGYWWDYVVLDEGHKIKNVSSQVSKACRRICRDERTHRLLLTGTPIQNNLKELWALFDWATSGQLLGPLRRFDNQYAKPIDDGRYESVTDITMKLAADANRNLRNKLRPHFLQRLKQDLMSSLPTKKEYVVWTHLSLRQRSLYESYVQTGENVASILRGDLSSPLTAVTWLKKLCGHPLLVSSSPDEAIETIQQTSARSLLKHSSKLEVLATLVNNLCSDGHRILVFSQSTKMLDIIEKVLAGLQISRIDGSTKERDRQKLVEEFNDEATTAEVMLLSTKAGGLGLTLTGADTAIVYDPSWNPAEDAQAVDRCYRIGQKRPVVVYRLISAGTVEEKMYEKQMHKDGLRRTVMTSTGNDTTRFFGKNELGQLFKLAPEGECAVLRKVLEITQGHLSLRSHPQVVAMSSHDKVYQTKAKPTFGSPASFAGVTPCKEKPGLRQPLHELGNDELFDKAKKKRTPNAETTLGAAANLTASGKNEEAIATLLDLLESGNVSTSEKIRLHKLIAQAASSLGWL